MVGFFNGLVPQPPFPWFTDAWAQFVRLRQQQQLPHAFLLTGPDGCGGEDLAMAMAQSLLCLASEDAGHCGKCKSCRLMNAQAHPDLVEVSPGEKSQFIKIESIRGVSEFVAKTAQQGGRKIVMILPAEAMNANAANALLKNLEEPSANTVFILVSYNPALLLATIRSRCSHWTWSIPPEQAAGAWLQRNAMVDWQEKLTQTGGRPLKALAWDTEGVFEQIAKVRSLLTGYLEGSQNLTATAKSLNGFDLAWLLDAVLTWVHQQASRSSHSGVVPADPLFRFQDLLLERKTQVLKGYNPNSQLVIEELLTRLPPAAQWTKVLSAQSI